MSEALSQALNQIPSVLLGIARMQQQERQQAERMQQESERMRYSERRMEADDDLSALNAFLRIDNPLIAIEAWEPGSEVGERAKAAMLPALISQYATEQKRSEDFSQFLSVGGTEALQGALTMPDLTGGQRTMIKDQLAILQGEKAFASARSLVEKYLETTPDAPDIIKDLAATGQWETAQKEILQQYPAGGLEALMGLFQTLDLSQTSNEALLEQVE